MHQVRSFNPATWLPAYWVKTIIREDHNIKFAATKVNNIPLFGKTSRISEDDVHAVGLQKNGLERLVSHLAPSLSDANTLYVDCLAEFQTIAMTDLTLASLKSLERRMTEKVKH